MTGHQFSLSADTENGCSNLDFILALKVNQQLF